MLRGTIRKIYLYSALSEFILIYPLYVVMFSDNGLNAIQISTLFVVWSAASIIAEVPTGVLADRYPRKNVLLAAQLIQVAGFLVWIVQPNYLGFAVGFALWGVGGAFASGAYEALVYDELEAQGRAGEYTLVIGKAESLELAATLLATLLAALAIPFGYNFVLTLSITAVLLAAAVVYTLPTVAPQEEAGADNYFGMMRNGFLAAFRNKYVLRIMLLGAIIGATYGVLEEYIPLVFDVDNVQLVYIPIAVAFTSLAAAMASYVAHRYEKLSTRAFMLLLAVSGLMLIIGASLSGLLSVVLLGGYTFLVSLLSVVYDGKLQHGISGKLRATITSVAGFFTELLAIVMYLVFGYISESINIFAAFKVFGIVIVAVALVYLLGFPKLLAKSKLKAASNLKTSTP